MKFLGKFAILPIAMRAREKLRKMAFVDINNCYRMATFRMLYSLTLIYFLQGQIFKCQYLDLFLNFQDQLSNWLF